jgi:hypothetical protein
MDAFILRCLAKDPRDRYADGKALEVALAALDVGEWSQAGAEASWRRWQNARAARAPDEVQDHGVDIRYRRGARRRARRGPARVSAHPDRCTPLNRDAWLRIQTTLRRHSFGRLCGVRQFREQRSVASGEQ